MDHNEPGRRTLSGFSFYTFSFFRLAVFPGISCHFRNMKHLLSEILRGTWLLNVQDPGQYQRIASAVLDGNFKEQPKPDAFKIMGKTSYDNAGNAIVKDKVAVISMIGEMTKYDTVCSYGSEYYVSEMLKAEQDADIKGIILKLDGPGGNADALPVFEEIKPLIKKPVVALVDQACSLHYFIASVLSSHIMMSNTVTAEVGSIGVQVVFLKPEQEVIIVRPPQSKDKNQVFIDALNGDYSRLEAKLVPLAVHFQDMVKKSRPKVKEEAICGNTYYADEAIKVGLADSIGTLSDAYNLVIAKAELKNIKK